MKLLTQPLALFLIVVAMLGAALTLVMRRLTARSLFVTGEPVDVNADFAVDLEHVQFFASDGVRLHGWLHKAAASHATVLFMHGTSYSILDMVREPERARVFGEFLERLGCDWFMFDYRGYGPSEGRPSERGVYQDAEAAIAYLQKRPDIDSSRMVFYGFSMGSAIATEMAIRHPCVGLMLRAPFSSIRDISESRIPFTRFLHGLMPWLPAVRFDTRGKIGRVRAPLLVMHGERDSTVPVWMGRLVFDLAGSEQKRFVELRDSDHGDFPIDQISPAISSFIDSLPEQPLASAAAARSWRLWDDSGDEAGERYSDSVEAATEPAVDAGRVASADAVSPPA